MAEMSWFEQLNERIKNDPNLQRAMLQFGANAARPYDIRKENAASSLMGALSGSTDYLQQLRDAEARKQMEQRKLQITEGHLDVAQRGASVGERQADISLQNANTMAGRAQVEKAGMEQGTIPLQQAQADYYRNKSRMETLKMEMEGKHKAKWDDKMFEAATVLAQCDPAEPGCSSKILYRLNQMAVSYGMPIVPPALEDIKDEELVRRVNTPEAEKIFLQHYGMAGAQRLQSLQRPAAIQPGTTTAPVSGQSAPSTPDPYALPETKMGAGGFGSILPSTSGSVASTNRERAADEIVTLVNSGRLLSRPTGDDVVARNKYNRYVGEMISRLKNGKAATEDAGKKSIYDEAIMELKKRGLTNGG